MQFLLDDLIYYNQLSDEITGINHIVLDDFNNPQPGLVTA